MQGPDILQMMQEDRDYGYAQALEDVVSFLRSEADRLHNLDAVQWAMPIDMLLIYSRKIQDGTWLNG